MVRRKLSRTPLLLATVLVLLFFTSMAMTSHTAFAHSAKQAPHGTVTFVVDGKAYPLVQGKTFMVPTTLPDGSKGYLGATFGTSLSAAPNSGDPCQTGHLTLQFYDAAGIVLGSYTLYQYWCWNGTNITSWNNPFAQWYSQLGWSMANHTESLTIPPSEESDKYGKSEGKFRFNGPLGIGCKSGLINLYFYNIGNYTGSAIFTSEFGC